jgi:hypothetical protein|tara:strand:- start:408 stop:572 length:165 start_codon:yes stop_codon:yes gene_type:complete
MASGDITLSTPVYADSEATIKTAADALNLAAATDQVIIIPWKNGALIMSANRTA